MFQNSQQHPDDVPGLVDRQAILETGNGNAVLSHFVHTNIMICVGLRLCCCTVVGHIIVML